MIARDQEATNRKRADFWTEFWVWALCLFAFGSIPVAALLLWGPRIVAAGKFFK